MLSMHQEQLDLASVETISVGKNLVFVNLWKQHNNAIKGDKGL